MQTICTTNGNECKTCTGSNCNSLTSFKKCIDCSSLNGMNLECIESPEKVLEKTCRKYDDECFTHIGEFDVSRGCLSDRSPYIEDLCRNDEEKCSICSLANDNVCNDKAIELETCIECNSKEDEKCENSPNLYKGKICNTISSTEKEGCFVNTESGFVRGCVRDLKDESKKRCLDQSDTCKTCTGMNCNVMHKFQKCYFNNTETDPKLIKSDGNQIKTCEKYDDECFTLITEDKGIVIKDCLHEYAKRMKLPNDFLKKFKKSSYHVCSSLLCNDQEIRPMHCIACDSAVDKTCIYSFLAERIKCPLEINPSGCYHNYDGKYTRRGCIADLDKEKRESCESNSDECKKCHGNECNWKPYLRKCMTANMKLVNEDESKICKRYEDECFIHVANEVVRRGCTSDFIESPIDGIDFESDCRNDTICEICDESLCNDKQVKNERCVKCDTKDNLWCTSHPEETRTVKCPLTLKQFGCYLWKRDGPPSVRRGCITDLDSDDRYECDSGRDTCKKCFGDQCNLKVEFQECYVCDSVTDGEDCLRPDFPRRKETCPNYTDHCYTKVMNGKVKRGCVGDKVVPTVDICDSNPETCKHCLDEKESGIVSCNTDPIEITTCISCNSTIDKTCATNTTFDQIVECPITSVHPQKCYHYIDEKTGVHERGCVRDMLDPLWYLCDENQECKTCIGKNCNSKRSFSKCVHCNSEKDPQCAINPQLTKNKVCDAYEDNCFTFIAKNNVLRGCLKEQDAHFDKECSTNEKKCIVCTPDGTGCNSEPIVMETCVECDSNKDQKCIQDPTKRKGKICSLIDSKDKQGCYLMVDDNRYTRGCVRDLTEMHKQDCLDQSETCKTCEGKDCNTKPDFQKCIECTSRDGGECVQNTTTNWIQCKNYLSTCLTGIDSAGYTHRNCSKDYERDSHDYPNDQFDVCSKSKCNTYIFPKDRLQCYECNGEDECDFMPNTDELFRRTQLLKPCGIFNKLDQCYAYLGEDDRIFRGCLTDTSGSRLLCEDSRGICVKCRDQNGCNDVPRVRPPSLSCIHCNRTHECAFGHEAGAAINCKNDVKLGSQESCFTRHNSDEDWIERGCTLDVPRSVVADPDRIDICMESGCNNENIQYSYCIHCNSNLDGQCSVISDPKLFSKQCLGVYPYDKRGCFRMQRNETIVRGCIKDLTADENEYCQNNKEECHLCLDNNCNTIGSSTRLVVNKFGALILPVFLFLIKSLQLY